MGYKGHKIGTGDEGHSGGHGRGQGGAGNWGGGVATSNQANPVIGHNSSGKGKGYNTEAHSDSHHGMGGEAVGSKADNGPMSYDGKLHMEGHELPHKGHGAKQARAAHHPAPSGEHHHFKHPAMQNAHGFGHGAGQRKGTLRMSGHSKAHRIGSR